MLGTIGGREPLHAVESLGIDTAAGRRASRPHPALQSRLPTQAKRVKKAQLKIKRAVRLMRQVGTAIRKVVRQNFLATISYGASVVGCLDHFLDSAKRTIGRTVGPFASGRCLNLTFFLGPMDIKFRLISAPLAKWHQEWWAATPFPADGRRHTLTQLKQLFLARQCD